MANYLGQWKSINPETFEYGQDGVEAIKGSLSSEEFNIQLNTIGFINEYATSSLENDFNSFAKNMFEPTSEFKRLLFEYELLQRKADLLIAFYEEIDPFFSMYFFNSLSTANTKLSIDGSIKVYPNPVENNLYLYNLPINSHIYILDFSGKIMMSIKAQSTFEQIYMKNLANGLYFIYVENKNLINHWKVIKK